MEMTKTIFSTIKQACSQIDDGRQPYQVLAKQMEEFGEMATEVNIASGYLRRPPGKDGIIGEGVDVIITTLDQMFLVNPGLTEEEVLAVLEKKLAKWYGYFKGS